MSVGHPMKKPKEKRIKFLELGFKTEFNQNNKDPQVQVYSLGDCLLTPAIEKNIS